MKKLLLILSMMILAACSGITQNKFLEDKDNVSQIQKIKNGYVSPVGCDKISEINKKSKFSEKDISELLPYFGLTNKDVYDLNKINNIDYSLLTKCDDYNKSIKKSSDEIDQYCRNKYYDEYSLETLVYFPFRLTSFVITLGTLGIIPTITEPANCENWEHTMHPWKCAAKASCTKYLSQEIPSKFEDVSSIKTKIDKFYTDYRIQLKNKNEAEMKADCEQAKAKAEAKYKSIISSVGEDKIFNIVGYVADFSNDGVFLKASDWGIETVKKEYDDSNNGISLLNANFFKERIYVYTSDNYYDGENFNNKGYLYKRVENYKYRTVNGGTNSVKAFKRSQYKISDLDYRTYLKNKDSICEKENKYENDF